MNMKALLIVALASVAVCLPSRALRAQVTSNVDAAQVTAIRLDMLAKVPEGVLFGREGRAWTVFKHPRFGILETVHVARPDGGFDLIGVQGRAVRTIVTFDKPMNSHPNLTERLEFTETGETIIPPGTLDGLAPELRAAYPYYAKDRAKKALQDFLAVQKEVGVDTDAGLEALLRRLKLIP